MKAALTDVFIEYRRRADEVNIDRLFISRNNEIAKEFEMLGFLCTYIGKRDGRVRFVRFSEPAQIPRFTSMPKEELGKARLENDGGIIIQALFHGEDILLFYQVQLYHGGLLPSCARPSDVKRRNK
jgi:hypothetical protein